ncbi:MAG: hypothetical protein OIN84_10365 [Candidatus Methanoperedens sp.]|uniref:hypothetical protein n=1 Tax=Candidatus Methanoperedens sp. BLZ2 TaxID=2035255 RepID=UPI000BE2222E|nr:hypothetical protein [Candidatus Methanoperedens sp. BLZ2]KAB2943777.1 MAG: hypothetical protein F9K14_15780 [Candidatus Methanoperedens sp.]MBZ0174670.1 hypothetical protein [Candidatus Methanoperedens nitroreducens]MCX9078366.1 hypothetical protein [Candidatus Methanoperedens sp.]
MKEIKTKARLLGILIGIGISIVAIAYMTGVSEQLPVGFQTRLVAVIDGNNGTVNLIQDEKIVQTIKLPDGVKGVEYFYDGKNKKIMIKYVTDEQLDSQRAVSKKVLDKAIQIVESDENVQQLISGKEYTIPVSGVMQDSEAKVIMVIGEKNYEVIVNLSTEKVVTTEEAKELNNSFNINSSGGGAIIYSKK